MKYIKSIFWKFLSNTTRKKKGVKTALQNMVKTIQTKCKCYKQSSFLTKPLPSLSSLALTILSTNNNSRQACSPSFSLTRQYQVLRNQALAVPTFKSCVGKMKTDSSLALKDRTQEKLAKVQKLSWQNSEPKYSYANLSKF